MNRCNLPFILLALLGTSSCVESPPRNKTVAANARPHADRHALNPDAPQPEVLGGLSTAQPGFESSPQPAAVSAPKDAFGWSRTYQSEGVKDVVTIQMKASGPALSGTISVAEYESPPKYSATFSGSIQGTNCVVRVSDSTNLSLADGASPGTFQWRLVENGKVLSVPMISSGRDASGHDVYRAEFALVEH